MTWFLYLIEYKDHSIYSDIIVDVETRYALHPKGKGARYICSHPPCRLLANIEYPARSTASKVEFEIKQLSALQTRVCCQEELRPTITITAFERSPDRGQGAGACYASALGA